MDIFISYAREDEGTAEKLAGALMRQGWSVFWDRKIPAGKTWREVIGAALDQASCVVVLWSKNSVASNWVLEEADHAVERGVLVPALIEAVKPPLGYGSMQAADLVAWKGDEESTAFGDFASVVRTRLEEGGSTNEADAENPVTPNDGSAKGAPAADQERVEPRTQSAAVNPRSSFSIALGVILLALIGWVVAAPFVHSDLPGTNMFIIAIVTVAAFIAFPVRPSASLLIVFGVHAINLFALWTTMSPTRRIEPATIALIVLIPLANALAVGLFCAWRLNASAGRPAPVPPERRKLLQVTVAALLLVWSAFAATAFAAEYGFNVRADDRGVYALPEVTLSLGVLWLVVFAVGLYVGVEARRSRLPEGITFGWAFVPLCAAIYFYQTFAQFDRLDTANGYYSLLVRSMNWQSITVLLATVFGVWLYNSTLRPRARFDRLGEEPEV